MLHFGFNHLIVCCFFSQLTIEYVFNVSEGYWTLIAADIDWAKSGSSNKTLFLSGDRPTAPTTFSYKCSRPLVFGTNNYYLELPNIQVTTYNIYTIKFQRLCEFHFCEGSSQQHERIGYETLCRAHTKTFEFVRR